MKQKQCILVISAVMVVFSSTIVGLFPARNAEAIQRLIFPIIGPAQYSNDFNGARANGLHRATDIFGEKGQPVVSTVNGTITYVPYPQPSYGYAVFIKDDFGYKYNYLHLNNDSPGTDDGRGGAMGAYAADVTGGNRVVKGQLLGYVGDSGNAEPTPPHIHFEIQRPDDSIVNPYDFLNQAERIPSQRAYPALPNEVLPYGANFKGSVNIAMGNFDADQQSEFMTGAGAGGEPRVRLYESDNSPINVNFYAYNAAFRGGVDVATGDLDGDGIDEIITGAGVGGPPTVKVFKADGSVERSFFAYSKSFKGGVKVATGDIDGDGIDEIITGAGVGGGPTVSVFKADGSKIRSFFAYSAGFRGGVDVSSADVRVGGSPADEIVTSVASKGSPTVKVFEADGTVISAFFAYTKQVNGGVRVSAANVDPSTPQAEILTVPAAGGPHLRMLNYRGITLDRREFIETWWEGFHDVAAGYDSSRAATGVNRRASVRAGI